MATRTICSAHAKAFDLTIAGSKRALRWLASDPVCPTGTTSLPQGSGNDIVCRHLAADEKSNYPVKAISSLKVTPNELKI